MAWLLLLVYVLNVLIVAAQLPFPVLEDYLLCNTTIDHANASGVFPFSVGFPPAHGSGLNAVPNPAWAVTVTTSQGKTESTIWYSPAGQNYSDDLALGYDACAFVAYGVSPNTVRLGQDDPGDCSKTLSPACRKAIISRLESSAYLLTEYPSPPPYSNLSAGVLPTLCNDILTDLGDSSYDYTKECQGQLGQYGPTTTELVQLTGFNTSIINEGTCTLNGTSEGTMFYNISTLASSQADAYDTYTRDLQIVLSVFFDVANVDRESGGTPASAQLSCLRPKQFSEGSRVSPVLPAGTPYTDPKGLSKGKIAGIVVGLVCVVSAGAAVAWWVWQRRRRGRGQATLEDSKLKEVDGAESHELHPRDRDHEVDSSAIHEVGKGYWKWVEKDASEPAVGELDGTEKPLEKAA